MFFPSTITEIIEIPVFFLRREYVQCTVRLQNLNENIVKLAETYMIKCARHSK